MIAELGQFALILALTLSLAQAGLSFAGRARRDVTLTGAGEGAALGAFVAIAIGYGALIHAFVTSDFSVVNVAENSHTSKPMIYKISGTWGNHEGSLLLFMFLIGAGGALSAPGWQAVVPQLVPVADLAPAVAANSVSSVEARARRCALILMR